MNRTQLQLYLVYFCMIVAASGLSLIIIFTSLVPGFEDIKHFQTNDCTTTRVIELDYPLCLGWECPTNANYSDFLILETMAVGSLHYSTSILVRCQEPDCVARTQVTYALGANQTCYYDDRDPSKILWESKTELGVLILMFLVATASALVALVALVYPIVAWIRSCRRVPNNQPTRLEDEVEMEQRL
jgi:hypothetical protein